MKPRLASRKYSVSKPFGRLAKNEAGVELIELALCLPILLLLLAGIFDFGQAWLLKDKIDGAARDGARETIATFNDMTNPQCGASCAVQAGAAAALGALTSANVNICGMDPTAMTATGAPFTWSESVTCANGGAFTLTIARAVPQVDSSSGTDTTFFNTQVTITYPYTVNFINMFNTSSISLSSAVTMANLN